MWEIVLWLCLGSFVLAIGNMTYDSEEHEIFRSQVTTLTANCGIANNARALDSKKNKRSAVEYIKPQIVGGRAAQVNSWPWMAALGNTGYRGSLHLKCGGALVHPRYVLTAAHCLPRREDRNLLVRLGAYNLWSNTDGASSFDVGIEKTIFYSQFTGRHLENDIALIRLDRKVSLSNCIRPVCLPPSNLSIEGQTTVVTGWGSTSEDGPISPILREVDLQVMRQSECRRNYYIKDTQLCAGSRDGGKDSCQGDSGGPLVYKDPTTQRYIVVGIVSKGRGCGRRKYPGIYIRVSKFTAWIMATIQP